MSSLASKQGPRYRHVVDGTAPYETIGVEKLTPIIGAEISGVDLSGTLSNSTMDEIHRALAENLVIFFRHEHITSQQPCIGSAAPAMKKTRTNTAAPPETGEAWHSELAYAQGRPMASIVYIR